jgi:hypothetical protein
MDATGNDAERRCAWCDAPAPETLVDCAECGAKLAQRETLGDLVIPGVTHVDPALQQYSKDPLRIPRASSSQYVAGPALGAAATVGGPAGLIALAALGAVAANEYNAASRGRRLTPEEIEKLGQPSEAALLMLKKLEEEGEVTPTEPDGAAASDAPPITGEGTPPIV